VRDPTIGSLEKITGIPGKSETRRGDRWDPDTILPSEFRHYGIRHHAFLSRSVPCIVLFYRLKKLMLLMFTLV